MTPRPYEIYKVLSHPGFSVANSSASVGVSEAYLSRVGDSRKPSATPIYSPAFEETVVTGHIVAHLNVFVCPDEGGPLPSETDLFLTLRYVSPSGEEIYYTSTVGDPTPLTKGWTRVSMRKVNEKHLRHREYLPYRDYYSTGVLPVMPGEVYPVDVEIWLSNVVVEKGGKLVLEYPQETLGPRKFSGTIIRLIAPRKSCKEKTISISGRYMRIT
ncbi:hypothetical protein ETB97_003549 [Aspergillus alliaceus]|uniref:Xaa-Pro dipeptidyl-peptidase C-terminal domain-containing protein n=1 Tax=Petromyces alliaceus TaxID=209559 RepID=A0A8H6E4A1_PETAA|nr:hypothetical protein ETB97_003549 [Aspergillus burnettii]